MTIDEEKTRQRNQFYDDLAAILRRDRREGEAATGETRTDTTQCGKIEERKDNDSATI